MRNPIALLVPVVLFALVLAVGVTIFAPDSAAWLLVGAAALLSVLPFIIAAATRRFDPFEPVYLFAACFLLLFVFRPITDLSAPGGIPILNLGRRKIDVSPEYSHAMVLAVIAGIAFYAGYYLPFLKRLGKKIPIPRSEWEVSSFDVFLLGGILISFSLFVVYMASTGILSDPQAGLAVILSTSRSPRATAAGVRASGYFYQAPLLLAPMGMLLLARSRKALTIGGLTGIGLVLLSQITTSGSRAFEVPAVLAVALLLYSLRNTRPSVRTLVIGATLLFLAGIELPRFYRDSGDLGSSLSSIAGSAVSTPQALLADFTTGADTAMIDDLSAELNVVPAVLPWQLGRNYLDAAVQWVPRQIWDNKPRVADNELVHTIDPIDYPPNTTAGFSFSIIGEPYLNFGIAGVAAELIIFGMAWRLLYEWFRRDPSNASVAVIYALCWPYLLVYMRGSIGADYYRQLLSVVPALLIVLLVNRGAASLTREGKRPQPVLQGSRASEAKSLPTGSRL
jgi:oligosaccharide repeat unit polymerase